MVEFGVFSFIQVFPICLFDWQIVFFFHKFVHLNSKLIQFFTLKGQGNGYGGNYGHGNGYGGGYNHGEF